MTAASLAAPRRQRVPGGDRRPRTTATLAQAWIEVYELPEKCLDQVFARAVPSDEYESHQRIVSELEEAAP